MILPLDLSVWLHNNVELKDVCNSVLADTHTHMFSLLFD